MFISFPICSTSDVANIKVENSKKGDNVEKAKYIMKKMLKLFLIIFISIFIYSFYMNLHAEENNISVLESRPKDLNNNSVEDIIENNFNSVVGISKLKENGTSIFLMNAANDLGLGTGIIVSKKGYILTNEHVSGDKNCFVTMPNGNVTKADVIWYDNNLDLAILKVDEKIEHYANLGDSENTKIGEEVYAIGNPIGYEFQRTVTFGIISALNRTIKIEDKNDYLYMSNLIQTDATINPGNSGGPLVNKQGQVIGINSVKITSADGIGFAIPINIIKPIIEKLDSVGRFEEAYLGIFAYDSAVIPYINKNIKMKKGVYIEKIYEDGPATSSELKEGDIITKIDDKEVNKMSDLQEYLYSKNPKDKINIIINREGKEKNISIELDKKEN